MVGIMAALLLGGTGMGSANVALADLPQIFEAACLNGEAKLSPGAAAAVGFDGLPRELRKSLGTPASAQVWRLNGPGRAFLYVLEFAPAANASPRICGLASDRMDYRSAADAVEMRVTGEIQPKTTPAVEWLNLEGGYNALAARTGDFKVLQINWLSDAQRAEAAKAYAPLVP